MFREMRRSNQQLSYEECVTILQQGTSGVLALFGDDGYPYAVPLSYAYTGGTLWFHGSLTGHKIDAIERCPKASFCVIDQDEVLPEQLTTVYRSVIAFGLASVLDDERQIAYGARILGEKYLPGGIQRVESEIAQSMPKLTVIRMDVEHLTGKEGVELTAKKKPNLFDSE